MRSRLMLVDDRMSAEDERTGVISLPLIVDVDAQLDTCRRARPADCRSRNCGSCRLRICASPFPVGLDRQVAAAAGRRPRRMAGEARHLHIFVREIVRGHARAPGEGFASVPSFDISLARAARGVEIGARRIDRVLHQRDFPFELGIDDGALDQDAPPAALDPLETPAAVGIAQQRQIGARRTSRGTGGVQRGIGADRAVAVLAADFDGVRHFAEDEAAAVRVLREMAVGALHALLGVDVHQLHGFAGIGARRNELAFALLAPFLRIVGRDLGPSASSRLPSRSRLKTPRKFQPWP